MNREIGNRETNRQVFYGNHVNRTQPISEDMFPENAYKVISERKNDDDLIILDVCTPKEFAKVHIENAINLNFSPEDSRANSMHWIKTRRILSIAKWGDVASWLRSR